MLGMLAIRLFLLAVEEFYGTISTSNDICCDNKGALYTFERKSQRVPSGKANTDIQRVLRTVKSRSKSTYVQHHVKSHQDRLKPWHKMTYREQLNKRCDDMAKKAILDHIAQQVARRNLGEDTSEEFTACLPLEKASVFVGGDKQTTDVGKGLTQVIGHQQARKFYSTPNNKGKILMEKPVFDSVDWGAINLALSGKFRMYQLWYGKQCSGWCGTGNRLKYWEKDADTRCPNCSVIGKTAGHLMCCRCPNRRKLLSDDADKLKDWMLAHRTHFGILQAVQTYVKHQGRRSFSRCCRGCEGARNLRRLAEEQDKIGWRHFTEGKLSLEFRRIQGKWLDKHHPYLTVDSWIKGFVSKLLEMTHAQWIYRCITKHHKTKGTKVLAVQEDLMTEIERLLDTGAEGVAQEDRWMLEIEQD